MTDAVQMLDHRYLRFLHQAFDQALAAAWHDHVDVLRHRDQFADCGAVGGLDDLHRVGRQTGAGQSFLDQFGERLIAMDRFRTAAQDGGVAALDAQAGRIDRHVRTRFVDDADHAQRHAHLTDLDPGRAVFHVRDFADRIGQCDDLFQSFGHGRNRLIGQRQTVQQGFCQTIRLGRFQILPIGGAQRVGITPNRGGDQRQRAVLGRGVGLRHCT